MKQDKGQATGPFPVFTVVTLAIVMTVVMLTGQTVVVNHLDAACEHTLGENATALEDQPLFDNQMDCVYPNGTIVEDVEPKTMNLTSAS